MKKQIKAAKSALNKPILRIPIPYNIQISNLLSTNIFITSGSKLGTHKHKLYQIYPTIPSYSTLPTSYQRKDQIIYGLLCIGHTRLTYSYLIEHTDPPKCTNCNQLLFIKHILTECTSYNQARHQYYSFTDIKNIISLTPSQNILNFILNKKYVLWNMVSAP